VLCLLDSPPELSQAANLDSNDTKPWTVTETMQIFPDTELLEFVCNENEKDLKHLVDK
jgi:hypothetical protein